MEHVLCIWVREHDQVNPAFCSELFTRVQPPEGLTLCILFYSLQPYWIVVTSEGVQEFQASMITTLSAFLGQVCSLFPTAVYALTITGEPEWKAKEVQKACKKAACTLSWLYWHQSQGASAMRNYTLRNCVVYYLSHADNSPDAFPALRDLIRHYHPDPLTWVKALAQCIQDIQNIQNSVTSVTLMEPRASYVFERLLANPSPEEAASLWDIVRPGYWGPADSTGVLLPVVLT